MHPVTNYIINRSEKMGPFGTMIEKDPTIANLEKKLAEKFAEIIPKEPSAPIVLASGVREVSFEDVLKELLASSKG